ncbi:PKD domain-containing protein [Streptomyces virginiae]|uniref:PKD domain-containing protein n=1 Tax=Streptomyces virginiae TaxID=1961 RepID=UPI002DB9173A|nr:PKD domain-containing protein [Streptomyces sp. CMAA1738]MEC4576527.1 PKD domain-containing protein [Streptomyces sp. CMAA1738]
MRPTPVAVLLTAGLVTVLGIPAVSAAEAPTYLFVNNATDANCSDTASGAGTKNTPFCSIQAAAKVVEPGQTVRLAPRAYGGALTINRSGEQGRPITFVTDATNPAHKAVLGDALSIDGASHVVLRGIIARQTKVERSSDIVVETSTLAHEFVIGAGSADVRISRSTIASGRIQGGAQRTILSRNYSNSTASLPAISVLDATDTAIANNSITSYCDAGISVSGGATGTSVANNVVFSERAQPRCETPLAPRHGLRVAQSAAAGIRVDYNVVHQRAEVTDAAYHWAGTDYKTPAEFRAATGQGAHDFVNPQDYDAAVVDSADATAPGALASLDIAGFGPMDDPGVANTGKDGGFLDRGAYESHDQLSTATVSVDQPWAPVGTTVEVKASSNSRWPTGMTYSVDFGDGSAPVVTRQGGDPAAVASHVYASPCACVVKVTASNAAGKKVHAEQPVKVTPAGALTAAFTATQVLPSSDSPAERISPLTVRFDPAASAAPWPLTRADVDFGDGTVEQVSDLSRLTHAYRAPGDYKVTLTLQDAKGTTSVSSQTFKADYAAAGYVATEPFRFYDSRGATPMMPGGVPLWMDLPIGLNKPEHPLSGSMSAVVLNVTVTGATQDTHLTVWPDGQARPATSNVNVLAGATTSNTVTVPVGNSNGALMQLNSGGASIIVDFVGYYQPNIGQRFSPLAPDRLLDTRATGGALPAGKPRTVKVAGVNGIPADATAVALNLTGTGSTENAHVIAYPDPARRPSTSNLNVEPGKDRSNQAIVPVGPNGTITLFTNSGSTHLVLDAVGYYGKGGTSLFKPVVPKRLGDTRTTGKLAPGATTTVSGLPANAVAAVLNITATDTTGPGFLTAYASGGTLPAASSLNTLPGITVPNHVTTPVGSGKVNIFNSWGGSNHVITDLLGYFTNP